MSISAVNISKGSIFFENVRGTISDLDGVDKIGALLCSIFDVIGHFWKSVETAVEGLTQYFFRFWDITCFLSIIRRIREFCCPDETGKMLWEHSWQLVTSTACKSVSNSLSVCSFLHEYKLANFGNAMQPINLINDIVSILTYTLESWYYLQISLEGNKKIERTCKRKKNWVDLQTSENLTADWRAFTHKKISKWQLQFQANQNNAKLKKQAEDKLAAWQSHSQLSDPAAVRGLCASRVQKWDKAIAALKAENRKNWVYFAVDVATVAGSILGILLAFFASALTLPLLILNLATNVADMIGYFM